MQTIYNFVDKPACNANFTEENPLDAEYKYMRI